ncbi:Hypothetical predicted protein [Marmota monax]|uniref:Rab-GAP TBC domain-containing protein n=1 Tax=Marmota monax TaxID=9995 RepID=A0A5E4B8N5_MARMO|nr:Hypothetical predicted protein [Marmota monax]
MLNNLITFLDPVFAEHLKGKGAGAVQALFPWFCLCFQRAFKSFDDVWRLWEVLLTGKPCRNFQVLVAYSMLQMVREQALLESMSGDAILLPSPASQTKPTADTFNLRNGLCYVLCCRPKEVVLHGLFSVPMCSSTSLDRLELPPHPHPCVHSRGSGHRPGHPGAQEYVTGWMN